MKKRVTHHWQKTPRPIRQVLVLILGVLVIIAGIIMLAIPGPGWATIFLGFAILATEFKSADRVKQWFIKVFKGSWEWLKARFK